MIGALLAITLYTAPLAAVDVRAIAWEWSARRRNFRVVRPAPVDKPPRQVKTTTIPVCEIVFTFEELWRCRIRP